MIDFEENKKIINQKKNRLENISSTLNLKEQEKKLEELEAQTIKDGFWNDNKLSNNVLKQIKEIKGRLKKYNDIYKQVADLSDLIELISIEYDEDLEKQLILLLKSVEKNLQKFEIDTLLSGKYDKNNAIISIHPGAGGTESQDWA